MLKKQRERTLHSLSVRLVCRFAYAAVWAMRLEGSERKFRSILLCFFLALRRRIISGAKCREVGYLCKEMVTLF